ncbi:ELMO domain containing protein [Pseudohyphozyma bogoriensis]|nr:ELMO domain containing protein [Pseudohyphozyma bogoriensis]
MSSLRETLALWRDSFSLTLLLESERGQTFSRLLEGLLEWMRLLLNQPTVLSSALKRELDTRGYQETEASAVISSQTLRIVDHSYFKNIAGSKRGFKATPIYPEELASTIAEAEGLKKKGDPAYRLLEESVTRVLRVYDMVDEVVERSETAYTPGETDDTLLKELFAVLKPDATLTGLVSKQWQDLGFQGTSPVTDFRGLGMLALDSFLYFGREYGDRAVELINEAVNGPNWYPAALGSIHMTSFALEMGVSRDLQLILLRSLQTRPVVATDTPDITPFLQLAAELLLLFHEHWMRNKFTVMQFEQVAKEFKTAVRPWVRRGVLDGRALGWEADVERKRRD